MPEVRPRRAANPAFMPWNDLREFLDEMERRGDLVRIGDRLSPDYDVVALTRQTSDVQGPALLFERIGDSGFPVLSGLFAAQRRVAAALGVMPEELYTAYREREERPIAPVLRSGPGACQQVVWTGEDIDLGRLPILRHYERDGGPYVTAGLQVARDSESGSHNVSIHRMLPVGRDRLTVFAPPGRHLRRIIERDEEHERGTAVATVIGAEPATQIASQARPGYGVDEFAIAGGLRGEPIELVRCASIDVWVPATAELVIEGVTEPGERVPDGPFGEYPGTYSDIKPAPVLRVTAITLRHQAIYQNTLTGMPMTENHWMMQATATAAVWREAARITPEIRAVHVTPGGACRHHAVIAIRKRHDAEARNVGLAVLAAGIGVKQAIVVDQDIDPFDALQVEWAVNTRVQPDRDLIVVGNLYSPTLDPSAPSLRASAKVVIDATAPLGRLDEFLPPRIPGLERLSLARYWSPDGR